MCAEKEREREQLPYENVMWLFENFAVYRYSVHNAYTLYIYTMKLNSD